MAHVLIAGQTMAGKSTLARQLVQQYKKADIASVVLDPLNDPHWNAEYQTDHADKFLHCAKQSWQCALFVDESGQSVGHYNDEMFWLATQARHRGHRSHFLTQRPAQLSPTVRDQCTRLLLFTVKPTDAKTLADEWNKPILLEAPDLPAGLCFDVQRYGEPKLINVFK